MEETGKKVFTKAELKTINKYYRYFNDGDRPRGTAYVLDRDVEFYLEYEANIAIAKAYERNFKNKASKLIHFYAKKNLVGFTAWEKGTKEI